MVLEAESMFSKASIWGSMWAICPAPLHYLGTLMQCIPLPHCILLSSLWRFTTELSPLHCSFVWWIICIPTQIIKTVPGNQVINYSYLLSQKFGWKGKNLNMKIQKCQWNLHSFTLYLFPFLIKGNNFNKKTKAKNVAILR